MHEFERFQNKKKKKKTKEKTRHRVRHGAGYKSGRSCSRISAPKSGPSDVTERRNINDGCASTAPELLQLNRPLACRAPVWLGT